MTISYSAFDITSILFVFHSFVLAIYLGGEDLRRGLSTANSDASCLCYAVLGSIVPAPGVDPLRLLNWNQLRWCKVLNPWLNRIIDRLASRSGKVCSIFQFSRSLVRSWDTFGRQDGSGQ